MPCDIPKPVPVNNNDSCTREASHHEGNDFREGRNGAGALLDMLAEIASQTLHSDPSMTFAHDSNSPQKIEEDIFPETPHSSTQRSPDISKDLANGNKRKVNTFFFQGCLVVLVNIT